MRVALQNNIREKKLVSEGDLVIVGISGGRDSVALLHGLNILSKEMGFFVVGAHFNHGIRGNDADQDQRFVEAFCKEIGVDYHSKKANIPELAAGENLEAVARRYRYGWLKQLVLEYRKKNLYNDVLIATAHHLEDQGETVLLHLLRGSGTDGLGGMKFKNGNIIRPFLNIPRSDIENYLAENKLSYRDDMSNFSVDYKRNSIRWELWPVLKKYNVNINTALGNVADICAVDSDFIIECSKQAIADIVLENSYGYYFNKQDFDKLHLAVKRKMVRELWRLAVVKKDPITGDADSNLALTYGQTEDILKLGSGKQISLPKEVYVKVQKGKMYIGKLPSEEQATTFFFKIKKNSKNR